MTDGGVVIRAIRVQAGTPSYTYGTSVLGVGPHTLQATYPGDTNNAPATSNVVTQTISKRVSVATCSTPPSPIVNVVNLTFTVSVAGNAPTGTVTFSESATTFGTAPLVGGVANAALRIPVTGIHTITATYSGDNIHLPSACTTTPVKVTFDPTVLLYLWFLDDD